MKQLTLGSLFDGIGGFCYAAGIPSGIDTGCTIKPLWAAEVEPNCIDITRYRFKDVMHVGSVTELKGDEIQPVDIITFGSPCQDLSIAGKRKGLKGNRSWVIHTRNKNYKRNEVSNKWTISNFHYLGERTRSFFK